MRRWRWSSSATSRRTTPPSGRATLSTQNGQPFLIEDRLAFDVPPEQREKIYEAAWEKGGLQFRATFRDLLADKAANDTAAEFIKSKIRQIVKDPATAEKLADIDHPYAAKRPPIDTDYFETFNRENVSLVDVRAAPIEAITPSGTANAGRPRVSARHHRIRDRLRCHDRPDAAHGYRRARRPDVGRGLGRGTAQLPRPAGRGLSQPVHDHRSRQSRPCCATCRWRSSSTWSGSPTASPICASAALRASRLVRNRWITGCRQVNEAAEATLLPLAHHSWYLGANVPGKPRVFMPYAGGMVRYRDICDDHARKGYEGFALSR